jgi:hypothetical protein
MLPFITSQRHNVDRLLALLLLWNVIGGAFVALGAPWLAEMAGTTELRSPAVLPTGFGWLAIGVPTQFAGIWLSVLGVYALHRMRRHLQWHLPAVLFYAPQTFAITSPLHVDMWIGLFGASVFRSPAGPSFAVNWIAITLLLVHAGMGLWGSRFRANPAEVLRQFWGSIPLSRTALSCRYASIATLTAVALLPLVPADAFYPSQHTSQFMETWTLSAWFDKEDVMFWRRLLLLPMTFGIAYVMAFVWSGGQREPRFSARRGLAASLLSYVYLAMAADLLSRWLSDGRESLFLLFMVAWVFLLYLVVLVPVAGTVAGAWLERKVAAPPQGEQRRPSRLTVAMWLTLVTPLLALLLSYVLIEWES